MKTALFRLTGGRVLAILLTFFALIIAANAFLVTLAVRSFPGEREKKSYLQGLAFNEQLEVRERQRALGWTAELSRSPHEDGVAFALAFTNAGGAPISDLEITGVLARPADDDADIPLAFAETEPGVYRATIDAAAGAWRLSAVATSARGERFELEKRLTLE